jgi:hypothetical protein
MCMGLHWIELTSLLASVQEKWKIIFASGEAITLR